MGNVIQLGRAAGLVLERYGHMTEDEIVPTDPNSMARLALNTQLEDSVTPLRLRDAAIAALDDFERAIGAPKLLHFLRDQAKIRAERAQS